MTIWTETNRTKDVADPHACARCRQVQPLGAYEMKEKYVAGGGPEYYHYLDLLVCPACGHEDEIGDHWDYDPND